MRELLTLPVENTKHTRTPSHLPTTPSFSRLPKKEGECERGRRASNVRCERAFKLSSLARARKRWCSKFPHGCLCLVWEARSRQERKFELTADESCAIIHMSATMTAATAAGRALLRAGSRARGGAGGGSRAARGLTSLSFNQRSQDHRGTQAVVAVGVAACAAVVGVATLVEAQDLEGMLPAFLLEKLQQQDSPKALARIEEVSDVKRKVRGVK